MLVDSEGKTCQSTASLLFMITPPLSREYSKGSNRPGYEDESVAVFDPKYQSTKNRSGHIETRLT